MLDPFTSLSHVHAEDGETLWSSRCISSPVGSSIILRLCKRPVGSGRFASSLGAWPALSPPLKRILFSRFALAEHVRCISGISQDDARPLA